MPIFGQISPGAQTKFVARKGWQCPLYPQMLTLAVPEGMSAKLEAERRMTFAASNQTLVGTKKAADLSATFVVRTSASIAPCDHRP